MLNAKNARLRLDSGETDYIRFGNGAKTLVMLPGVGDGLKTVRGMALPFSLQFRELAKDFTVYVFSRRVSLPEHMSTREMAEDLNAAMEALGLRDAALVGVSQGGMIAQWLAVDHPDKVGKLVLVVTLSRPNETVREAIAGWTKMAERGDYRGIMLDTAERSYSEKRLRQARLAYSLLGSLGKPKSFARFLTQAESCVTHDCYERLCEIATGEASADIARALPGRELYIYEGLSHGLYEEAPDFLGRVAAFCR